MNKQFFRFRNSIFPLAILLLFFISAVTYSQDSSIDINTTLDVAEEYITANKKEMAKEKVRSLKERILDDWQQYRLQQILKRISSNQIGVNYELISFTKDFPVHKSWNSVSAEYQHYFGANSVAGRITYSDRFINDGVLYELDTYPVFSKKLYGNAVLSFSEGGFYQRFGTSASLFYSLGNGYEVEGGIRYLNYEQDNFLSTSLGLTKYVGSFYLNARASFGPKKDDRFIQNYQVTTRYYFSNAADFAYVRIGTGISPDDVNRFSQVVNNPSLKAYYVSTGFRKWFKDFSLGAGIGYLTEELNNNNNNMKGGQFTFSTQLRYRF
mgnify:FL=1